MNGVDEDSSSSFFGESEAKGFGYIGALLVEFLALQSDCILADLIESKVKNSFDASVDDTSSVGSLVEPVADCVLPFGCLDLHLS